MYVGACVSHRFAQRTKCRCRRPRAWGGRGLSVACLVLSYPPPPHLRCRCCPFFPFSFLPSSSSLTCAIVTAVLFIINRARPPIVRPPKTAPFDHPDHPRHTHTIVDPRQPSARLISAGVVPRRWLVADLRRSKQEEQVGKARKPAPDWSLAVQTHGQQTPFTLLLDY